MGIPRQAGSLPQPSEGAVPLARAGTVLGALLSCLLNGGMTFQSHPRVGIPGVWLGPVGTQVLEGPQQRSLLQPVDG